MKDSVTKLKEIIKKMGYFNSMSSIMYWDMSVNAPKKSIDYRSELLGFASTEVHKLMTSDSVKELLHEIQYEELDVVDKAMYREIKKEYEKATKIPEEKVHEYAVISSKSEVAWEEAKEKSDFGIFKPHLEKVINMKKEYVKFIGSKGNKYDTLLDEFEKGMTVDKLDKLFEELKSGILELLNKIKKSNKENEDKLSGNYPIEKQKEFSLKVMKDLGFDFDGGRLDKSVHPYTINLGYGDVRITTHYNDKDLRPAVLGCIHECGHALYEQGFKEELYNKGLSDGASMGIHESQSLFYENIIGQSMEFWKYYYTDLQEYFKDIKNMKFQEFYEQINRVVPSLIRIDADELTYCLHIIIRYEIEKAIFNEEVEVDNLKDLWNEKYEEYLGVRPNKDSEGILQDMHWSDGSFGYFPSYALGNLYAAQFRNKIMNENPEILEEIENGNFESILKWLRENIHKHGAVYSPSELVRNITGEELQAKFFIEYLNDKYSKIYDL